NRWRDSKSPLQLLRERAAHLDKGILNLPPIRLEILLDEELKGGYHVPGSVQMKAFFPCYLSLVMIG
ncbi:hypothetical protein LR013_05415, partial [candidate division NPL-UPA2 bacterium]|nr:hypothetical protein [candidate division NPL-UPA2 bacterium]